MQKFESTAVPNERDALLPNKDVNLDTGTSHSPDTSSNGTINKNGVINISKNNDSNLNQNQNLNSNTNANTNANTNINKESVMDISHASISSVSSVSTDKNATSDSKSESAALLEQYNKSNTRNLPQNGVGIAKPPLGARTAAVGYTPLVLGKRPVALPKISVGKKTALTSSTSTALRMGPQRTSRTAQKLKLLPDEPLPEDEESGHDVYSQVSRIKDHHARRDAERLGKAERSKLPRVTAYCTASSYRMKDLMRYLNTRKSFRAQPKLFDECLYTPYSYRLSSKIPLNQLKDGYLSLTDEDETDSISSSKSTSTSPSNSSSNSASSAADINVGIVGLGDVFLFDYGVTVFWGFTDDEELRFLKEIERFETEKLAYEDVEIEEFNYYITSLYQPRIYNDFITLRDDKAYIVKLSISHAIAQSVKISLFEALLDDTIEDTQDIPEEIALTGKVQMSRKKIMMSIGELFILRININLHGSIMDSPELMWSEPHLEPIYLAARSYLEINQRVTLLNQRLEVIGDFLQMLKEQLSYSHGEYLEVIVIVLVAVEVLVAIINIIVDLIAENAIKQRN